MSTLNQCSTVDEAAQFLLSVPADISYALQIADESRCVSVERATFGGRVRLGAVDGVLAAYNSFVPPYPEEWSGKITDPPSTDRDPRYANLIALADSDRFRGNLDVETMKDLMDLDVENGGAVLRRTVYQVIAQPGTLTLWIRALDYSDWQQVSLADLFESR